MTSDKALAIRALGARLYAFVAEERRLLAAAGIQARLRVDASLGGLPPDLVEEVDDRSQLRSHDDSREYLTGYALGGLLTPEALAVTSTSWPKPGGNDWRQRAGLAPSRHGEPDDSIRRDLEESRT